MSRGSSGLTAGDVVEAVVVAGIAGLRARDVPTRHRTLFEVGRSVASGASGYVSARRSTALSDEPDAPPSGMLVGLAAGAAVTAFAARGLTQRTEDRIDATLSRLHVPAPRVVVALAVGASTLWSRASERRRAAQAFTDDMSA